MMMNNYLWNEICVTVCLSGVWYGSYISMEAKVLSTMLCWVYYIYYSLYHLETWLLCSTRHAKHFIESMHRSVISWIFVFVCLSWVWEWHIYVYIPMEAKVPSRAITSITLHTICKLVISFQDRSSIFRVYPSNVLLIGQYHLQLCNIIAEYMYDRSW